MYFLVLALIYSIQAMDDAEYHAPIKLGILQTLIENSALKEYNRVITVGPLTHKRRTSFRM